MAARARPRPSSHQAGHHGLPPHEVLILLETDAGQGLTEEEASERLDRFGPNSLPPTTGAGPVVRALRQFHHPLIYVLSAAGLVTLLLSEYVDAAVIFGVVLVNAAVGFIQESRAEAALEGLRAMVLTEARVIRDGATRTVPSEDLVPGDLVRLEGGDRVPADLRLLHAAELRIDESALTGEAIATHKNELALPPDTGVADRRNMAYSGTLVTTGSGLGVTVATGDNTQLGAIHRLVGGTETLATPLSQKLAAFSRKLTIAILALAAVTFAAGVLRGQGAAETFTAAVALAVGAIPEGLPAAVTITMAIGVTRLARRRAVVRRLSAVETLGSTTVICSDKTGTLTENAMTVRTVWAAARGYNVIGSGYDPGGELQDAHGARADLGSNQALWWCLLAGALCNDAHLTQRDDRWCVLGDPTEGAMLSVADRAGLDRAGLWRAHPRLGTIPFTSDRNYMATMHDHDGDRVVLVKGSVEKVTRMCSGEMDATGQARPLDRSAVLDEAHRLAGRGLRVLATAVSTTRPADDLTEHTFPDTLLLTGLQAMLDPPRAASRDAVAACRAAGIEVKMITGDHAATATAIANQIGLLDGPPRTDRLVLTGRDLDTLDGPEYVDAVDRAVVFARVSPEQKLRLVEGLQAQGHIVAMTGDGVNDAPALQQANIGLAMGLCGTEVAKDAADIVLTDDDFATIEAAVEEGRGIFDNLVKFITWTLPTNVAEGLVVLTAIVLGLSLPILPTQILWINMTTAVALGLMLVFEPKEAGIMQRAPRDPRRPLITRAVVARILIVSGLMVGGAWWLFEWELSNGAGVSVARTAALNLFVAVEALYLFTCRSLTRSVWSLGPFSNPWLVLGVAVQGLGQLAITYLPALNTIFGTAPLGGDAWLRIGVIALGVAVIVEGEKALRRRTATAA